ncbi:MAG: molybdate transport system regulatory protein [Moritella sp.]|jgi:molybdate transport system regulatory protein
MDLKAQLTISVADKVFANPKRVMLLQQIQACGSISQGAKLAGMSYKTAWDAVKDMNTRLPEAVVCSEKGGKGGGGAKLTSFGERLLQMYALTEQMQAMVLAALQDQAIPMNNLLDVVAHFSLKTSARNQLSGKIVAVTGDDFYAQISVELAGGQRLQARVTHCSSQKLALVVGKPILMLVKAPAVSINAITCFSNGMNQLVGTVLGLHSNAQTTEVSLAIGVNQTVYASIDTQIANELQLAVGGEYYAVFSPSQTIVACMD